MLVFVAVHWTRGGYSSCRVWASYCDGCSCGEGCAGFVSCTAWAQYLWCMDFSVVATSMWDLLGLGIETMPPALAHGFLTTGPPGKSTHGNLKKKKKALFLGDSFFVVSGANVRLVQFSSVAQSCLTLCDHVDCSTPGLPVHHQLLEFTQTHVHSVSKAIQPSHPLLPPSPPAFNLSQHQEGLFK